MSDRDRLLEGDAKYTEILCRYSTLKKDAERVLRRLEGEKEKLFRDAEKAVYTSKAYQEVSWNIDEAYYKLQALENAEEEEVDRLFEDYMDVFTTGEHQLATRFDERTGQERGLLLNK